MSTAAPSCRPQTPVASDWKAFSKNTLKGFFTLQLPSGMVIHGLTAHVKGESRWIGLPGQKFVKTDGTTSYTPVIEFTDRLTADRFRDLALAALKEIGVSL
jgi:hypothetical protein